MATKDKYEPNFHKGTKQWYKKLKEPDGKWKTIYLGAGKNKSDRSSKSKAKAKLKLLIDEREIAESHVRIHLHYKSILDGTKDINTLPPAIADMVQRAADAEPQPTHNPMDDLLPDKLEGKYQHLTAEAVRKQLMAQHRPKQISDMTPDELDEYLETPETFEAQTARQLLYSRSSSERIAKPKKGKPTIAQQVDEWLKYEQGRVATDSVVQRTVDKQKSGIKPFVGHVNGDYFNGNVEEMLMSFRAKIDKKFAGGEISGWTHRGYIKAAWQFIEWCYTNRKLQEKPRCNKAFCKQVPVTKEGKPINLADIGKIWEAAGDRQKCFIALGLNCAMKNGDIAALKGKQVQGDRVIGYRPKSKRNPNPTPFNMKLWPITVQLIEKVRDNHGDDELLFVNSKGADIDSGVFSSLFKKVSTRAGVLAGKTKGGEDKGVTFEQLRDTSIDLIQDEIRDSGKFDGGLLQVFQQHRDPSTAAYYTSNKPKQIDRLDDLTDYLGKQYELKL